ncbi:MAG: AMP-binding protein [Actinomycetales bacterium]|nr:AMP-binding protein [Actinomycetales bacterium]
MDRSLLESGVDSLAVIHLQALLSRDYGVSMRFHEILASHPLELLDAVGGNVPRAKSGLSAKRLGMDLEVSKSREPRDWMPLNPIVKDVITKDAFSPSDTFHLAWRIKDPRAWNEAEFVRRLTAVRQKWSSLRSRWSAKKGARVLSRSEGQPELRVFTEAPSKETQENFLHQRMDLELTDPFRVAMWPGEHGGSEALFVVHHIAADGVMASEVIEDLYAIGKSEARISTASGEPDVSRDEFGELADVDWWVDQLANRLQGTGLPVIENREGRDAEQAFAARHESSLAMKAEDVGSGVPHGRIAFAIAAWAIIVADRLARDRVVIGLPFAMDSSHGLSANMLPIVVELADQTMTDVLDSIRRQIAEGIEHRKCSLGAIANKMSDGASHLRPPVDGVLTIDDIDRVVDEVSIRWVPMKYSAFQASAVIPNSKREGLFAVEAERGFLDGESADSILERWLHVMRDLVKQVESQSSPTMADSIAVLPSSMLDQLEAFGEAESVAESKQSVLSRFDRMLESCHDDVALIDGRQSITYGELDAWSRAIGARLLGVGIRVGDPVAVSATRGLAAVAGFLGVLRAGGWFVPIDPEIPDARKIEQIKTAGITAALNCTGPECFPSQVPLRTVDIDACRGDEREQAELPGDDPEIVDGESPMYGMFTSGTTGTPRCVMVPHRAVVRLVEDPFFIRLDTNSRMLNAAPLAFDASTIEIWGPLLNGGLVAIWTGHSGDVFGLTEFVQKNQINQCWLTTAIFNVIVDTFSQFFNTISTVMTGGDVVSVSHVRKVMAEHPRLTVVNGYGPTENTVFTACDVMPAGRPPEGHSVPVGRPIRGAQVRIVDNRGRLVPRGCFGQLLVKGAGLALGYLEGAGEPKAIGGFRRSVTTGEIEYHTGDYARWTSDGILEFGGRKDSQAKLSGHRIELEAIDRVLRNHAKVRDASSCIVKLDGRPVLMAAIVLNEGASFEESKIREDLGQSLLAWEVPSRIVAMGEMPITTNGKPDRRAIAATLESSPIPSTTDSVIRSQELGDCVVEALRMSTSRRIDPEIGLRSQGLDSLDLLRLAIDLEKVLGRPLPLSEMLSNASVRSITKAIAQDLHREAQPTITLRQGVERCRTGVLCIPGVGGTVFSFDRILDGLPPWCPVYGLPYPGISGDRKPLSRVGDLADALVESSLPELPKNPVLVGYSFGAFVAFEFSRRIKERGFEPIMVAIDASPASLAFYKGEFGRLRQWKLKLANVMPESIARRTGFRSSFAMKQLRSVVAASFEAIRHYEPEPLDVPVHLLRTTKTDFSPFDKNEDLGWRALSSRVSVDYLPGQHLEVFRVASMELAEKVRELVNHKRGGD